MGYHQLKRDWVTSFASLVGGKAASTRLRISNRRHLVNAKKQQEIRAEGALALGTNGVDYSDCKCLRPNRRSLRRESISPLAWAL
jgi:hypothetical protein